MKTMVDNAKIARMEKNIKETDAKVKNIKSVPPSTAADAGKVLTVNEDGSLSWQQKGAGGGMKAYFDAGGKCALSTVENFDGIIAFDDTSDMVDMKNMFIQCFNLLNVPLFDTSKCVNMSNMFDSCNKLKNVPLLDTRRVTNMNQMFEYCSNLVSIPAFDVSNVSTMADMLYECSKLETIHMKNINTNLTIKSSTLFTREALLEIIGNLKTVTSTKTLTMGSTNLAKLTDEDKAIATNKGWTLA